MKTRIGHLHSVKNTNKKHSEIDSYNCVIIKIDGNQLELLLTDLELSNAISRAKKNPEDVLHRSFISKLID
jgi:hypothetical protein